MFPQRGPPTMRSGYAHPEGLHTGRPHDAGSVSEQRKSCQYFCKHLKAPIFIWENCSWWWSCHSKYNTLALNRKPIIFDYPIHQSDGNNVIKVPCPGNSSNQMRYWKWFKIQSISAVMKAFDTGFRSVTQLCYIGFLQGSELSLQEYNSTQVKNA